MFCRKYDDRMFHVTHYSGIRKFTSFCCYLSDHVHVIFRLLFLMVLLTFLANKSGKWYTSKI